MHPGRACISCHSAEGEGPRFDVAGTLYASAHEPNDCNGAPLDTRVIITDATGRELVIAPNGVGNFSARRTNLVMPYTARLERGDRVREMVSAQSTGDCNGCHTESGKNKAPGRIMAP
jgi:cytochrome c553